MGPAEQKQFRISVILDGKMVGFVKDITEDGMSVSTARQFDKGAHLELGLSVPGALRAIPFKCLVLDGVPGESLDAGFVDLDRVSLESLRTILKKVSEARTESVSYGGKKKVLLVEDTAQIRNVYKGRLMLDGYDVVAVESAMEAMSYLRDFTPDLVLLDLVMPIMDGFKLLKVIRETPRMAELPVIILSAKGATEEIEKAMAIGISGYLIKTTTSPVKLSQEVKNFFANR
jgi:CheY-like chemotaxis protein